MWIAWKRQLNIWSRRQEIFWQRQEDKELAAFAESSQITKNSVLARVLSTAKVAHKCEQLGFTGKNCSHAGTIFGGNELCNYEEL